MQQRVVDQLGGVAKPSRVYVVNALPQRDPGDLSTLDDPAALDDIRCALERGPDRGD